MENLRILREPEISQQPELPAHLKRAIGQAYIAGLEAGYWEEIAVILTPELVAVVADESNFSSKRVILINSDGTFTQPTYIPIVD